ncbi:MAG TPA: hypothetical protein VGL91_10680 [Acidobacteriota bacterium]
MRLMRNFILFLLLLPAPVSLMAQAQQETRAAETSQTSDEVLAKLQTAAVLHETIQLAVKEGKYSEIIPNLKKIFDLGLPRDYEKYQVKAVYQAVLKLDENRQFILGHKVVDLALENLQTDDSKFNLYLMKAQLFRNNGQIRESFEALETSKKFEKQQKDRRK